jgi:hypothetical protein
MAGKSFRNGERVEWDSSGGHSHGKVVKKVTGTETIKGHTAKASQDEPQYRVKSDSGGEAIHKPDALKKAR